MAYTFHKTFDKLRERAERIATQGKANALIALCILDLTDIVESLTEEGEADSIKEMFSQMPLAGGKVIKVSEDVMKKLTDGEDAAEPEKEHTGQYL